MEEQQSHLCKPMAFRSSVVVWLRYCQAISSHEKGGKNIRKLGERRFLFRHLTVIRSVGFIILIQNAPLIMTRSIESHRHMGRLHHPNDLQQGTDEA